METTKSIIDPKYIGRYPSMRVRDENGKLRYVRSNGDAVARAMTLHCLIGKNDALDVAEANGIELMDDYSNPGGLRMAIGNKLRAKVRRGEPVHIGEYTIKDLDQKVPTVEAATRSVRPPAENGDETLRRVPRRATTPARMSKSVQAKRSISAAPVKRGPGRPRNSA